MSQDSTGHQLHIGWLSRHSPTVRQLKELKRIFPDHRLTLDTNAFAGADEILERIKKAHYDEIVIVAPLSMIRALTDRGIKPIYAEMKQVPCDSKEVEVRIKARCYKFVAFNLLEGVHLKMRRL